MQESLSPEHGRELVTDTLEQGLDAEWRKKKQGIMLVLHSTSRIDSTQHRDSRGGVGNESSRHLETSRSNVTARQNKQPNVSLHAPIDHEALS
jgi:hypothetical protein